MFVVPPHRLFASEDPQLVEAYRDALTNYFDPYHRLVDRILRVCMDHNAVQEEVVNLSLYIGLESLRLGTAYFCKLVFLLILLFECMRGEWGIYLSLL